MEAEIARSTVLLRLALALLGALAAVVLAPAGALAAGGDAAATSAYIQANYRLVQAAASRIRPIGATLQGVLGQVRGECPMAAAGSPQDAQSTQLSNEVIGAMVTAVVHLDPSAAREFVSAAGRLTWSDPTPPPGCTSNVTEPGAEKGNLCVFAREEGNLSALARKFVHVLGQAAWAAGRSSRWARRSRSARVNFHSNGWAICS